MPFPVLAEGLPEKLAGEAPMLICSPPVLTAEGKSGRAVFMPLLDNKSHFLFAGESVELIFFPLGLMGLCVQE